jgi:hypothetical protein
MARAASNIDYLAELSQIRDAYVSATPRQRLSIARQRLQDHHFGPNRLVTSVSAVEALARCLVQHVNARSKEDLHKSYSRYRNWTATPLVREYLVKRGITDPTAFLEEDNWRLFGYAVQFRNLLVHECTYLGLDKFPSLIAACEVVLEKLVKLGNVRERRS